MCDFGEDMGHCFSLPSSSSEIHEENEHGDGNAVVCYGDEFGLDHYRPVHRPGSVCSIQGTKAINQDNAILYLVLHLEILLFSCFYIPSLLFYKSLF